MIPEKPATLGRCEIDGDWIVRQFIGASELANDPEEYVARHAHHLGTFGFPAYRFADPALGAWVRRVGELLSSESEVERCRTRFLTREELAEARKLAEEDL